MSLRKSSQPHQAETGLSLLGGLLVLAVIGIAVAVAAQFLI
ncbi:hypothetical protein BER2_1969 [plant metagenome]|uniref:Uncharacterized protein n=2 Tax=root TaxID=1 RepID=A0A1C3K8C2_9BURK|nr:hypothetical protein [Orrella dioscoreae]SBT27781.1 hypothetical protein ODI_02073 [Orrella dioscoreae]SOE49341.1 hypothetical protein ODI_R2007 [Orrella dioscoreae]